jgi:phosphonate dehydrogenase
MTTQRPRIVVSNLAYGETLARLATIGEIDANPDPAPWPRSELMRRLAVADAMLAFMPDCVDRDLLAHCRHLKVVACALKGCDNFDIAACSEAGIWVTVVPDLLTAPTAELAVGLAIGLGRMIRQGDAIVRAGAFQGWRPILYGTGLAGATVSIVGMGRLGRAIAERLAGFGCRLIGVDPQAELPPGIIRCDLSAAISAGDFVIVAAPLTAATHHLVARDAIARMRPGALLVNVGRGSVVDEHAVVEALEAGTLGGYAADVFELEDWALSDRPDRVDPRLRAHPRTLLTPHLGSAVADVRRAIEMCAADNIADALAGRRPRDAINDPLAVADRSATRLRIPPT